MVNINPNSILFFYEGETEGEFYSKLFIKYVPHRKIKITKSNLRGIYNINKKVKNRILHFLDDKPDQNQIYVIVAYDREGPRNKTPELNITLLKNELVSTNSRIKSIRQIVATQDLESWFFHDIEGIYKFLKTPVAQRNIKKYNNIEATNNKILSELFHKYNKHYQKGTRVEGFINKLDLDLIYNNVNELQRAFKFIQSLCK